MDINMTNQHLNFDEILANEKNECEILACKIKKESSESCDETEQEHSRGDRALSGWDRISQNGLLKENECEILACKIKKESSESCDETEQEHSRGDRALSGWDRISQNGLLKEEDVEIFMKEEIKEEDLEDESSLNEDTFETGLENSPEGKPASYSGVRRSTRWQVQHEEDNCSHFLVPPRACRSGESSMDVEILVSLVQERHAIYDPSDPMYRNRDVLAALWKDIAAEMKCKESDCKEKWHQLRSNFMREKRKVTTHASGSASIKAKKWVFYDAMEFLMPYVTPRGTSSNVTPPPNEDINTEFDTDDAALNDTSSTTSITVVPDSARSVQTATNVDVCEMESTSSVMKQPSSTAKKQNAIKRHHCELPSDVDQQIVGELQKLREQAVCKNENESDPDRQFLLSLLPLMKQLSPIDSLDIKIEIHEAFRRKLDTNRNFSYVSCSAPNQNPSHGTPLPYAHNTPSPYAHKTPSPYAHKTPSPYASETDLE